MNIVLILHTGSTVMRRLWVSLVCFDWSDHCADEDVKMTAWLDLRRNVLCRCRIRGLDRSVVTILLRCCFHLIL